MCPDDISNYEKVAKSKDKKIDMDIYFNILKKNDKFWQLVVDIVGKKLTNAKKQKIIKHLKESN